MRKVKMASKKKAKKKAKKKTTRGPGTRSTGPKKMK